MRPRGSHVIENTGVKQLAIHGKAPARHAQTTYSSSWTSTFPRCRCPGNELTSLTYGYASVTWCGNLHVGV